MAKKTKKPTLKRRSTRFSPDPLNTAQLQFYPQSDLFQPDHVALIVNESYTGACLVLQTKKKLKPEMKVIVKTGKLAPMAAEVIWIRQLDVDLFKIGIDYFE